MTLQGLSSPVFPGTPNFSNRLSWHIQQWLVSCCPLWPPTQEEPGWSMPGFWTPGHKPDVFLYLKNSFSLVSWCSILETCFSSSWALDTHREGHSAPGGQNITKQRVPGGHGAGRRPRASEQGCQLDVCATLQAENKSGRVTEPQIAISLHQERLPEFCNRWAGSSHQNPGPRRWGCCVRSCCAPWLR